MTALIIVVILFVVLFFFRKKIVAFIIKYREQKKPSRPKVKADLVYVPTLSSRTFVFAIEITEVGNGKATLSVVKMKE